MRWAVSGLIDLLCSQWCLIRTEPNSFNPFLCSFSHPFPFFSPLILNMSVEKSMNWRTLISWDSSQVEPSPCVVICMSYESLKQKEIRFPSLKTKRDPDSVGLSRRQRLLFVPLWWHELPELRRGLHEFILTPVKETSGGQLYQAGKGEGRGSFLLIWDLCLSGEGHVCAWDPFLPEGLRFHLQILASRWQISNNQ